MPLRFVMTALVLLLVAAFGLIAFQITDAARPAQIASVVPERANPPSPVAKVAYLVTARALPPGTLARPEDFTIRAAVPNQLPPDAVIDTPNTRADLRGSLVRRFLETGTPLRAADLTRPRERGFLAAVLSPGTRAVAIGVDAVSGVAGLVWPGDRVDVLLTQDFPATAASPRRIVVSETILTDCRLVAVDQDITQGAPADGGAGRLATTVTLEVTSDQAERLAMSARLGRLSLAARAVADPAQPIVIAPRVVGGGEMAELPPIPVPAPAPLVAPTAALIPLRAPIQIQTPTQVQAQAQAQAADPALAPIQAQVQPRAPGSGGTRMRVIQGDHRSDVEFK